MYPSSAAAATINIQRLPGGISMRGIVLGTYFQRAYVFIGMAAVQRLRRGETAHPEPHRALYKPRPELVDPAIRRSLLYFDRIEWPTNNLLPPEVPGFEILQQQGILTRTHLHISPSAAQYTGDLYDVSIGAHRLAFQRLEATESGQWTFGHLGTNDIPWWGPQLVADQPAIAEMRAIEFELYSALPVPASSVQFAEILDFKERRRAELMALRTHLDDLYTEIVNSADVPRTKTVGRERLDRALSDLADAMRASRFKAQWLSQ